MPIGSSRLTPSLCAAASTSSNCSRVWAGAGALKRASAVQRISSKSPSRRGNCSGGSSVTAFSTFWSSARIRFQLRSGRLASCLFTVTEVTLHPVLPVSRARVTVIWGQPVTPVTNPIPTNPRALLVRCAENPRDSSCSENRFCEPGRSSFRLHQPCQLVNSADADVQEV